MSAANDVPFGIPVTAEVFRGALRVEPTPYGQRPHRLPAWALEQADDQRLGTAAAQPSGVRLALRTAARVLEVDVLPTRLRYAGVPPRPAGVYDLLVDGELVGQASTSGGITVTVDMATGSSTHDAGRPGTLRFTDLPAGEKDLELWLPHNESTEIVAIRADAELAASPAPARRVWLHHGSSVSQGSNTAGPSTTWPALAANAAGVELINLGFSGNALLDPCVARVLRDTPADLISVKFGINVVNADLMRLRAFIPAVHGFLDTIREGHPDTPLLVISSVYCGIHEDTPGPGAFDVAALRTGEVRFVATGDPAEVPAGRLTLRVIREHLARIVHQRAKQDPALCYLDGLDLYGEADAAELPLPDALHPDAAGHRRIAERFTDLAFGFGGLFEPRSAGDA